MKKGGGVVAPKVKEEIEWVRFPADKFLMGSYDGPPTERPIHDVALSSFEMSRTEITVGQYRRCVEAGACGVPAGDSSKCNWGKPDRDNHPVNCVTWKQAQEFAMWAGGRLPTEAEWEYAARSGGQKQAYPWGSEKVSCDRAVIGERDDGCGKSSTWPVCSKSRGNSKQGLCDMVGNVWEWVFDWHQPDYSGAAAKNPAGPKEGKLKVLRGGSWIYNSILPTATGRIASQPEKADYAYGFRVVRTHASITWIPIAGGTFKMGSDKSAADEKPVHEVTVDDFEMSATEVTVGQYRDCVAAGVCTVPDSRAAGCNWGLDDREYHPVNCVSFEQAQRFAFWVGGRLPTESEWEYAARSQGKQRKFPWGDDNAGCKKAVVRDPENGCGKGASLEVCSRKDGNTAQGLCDMAGNVGEWTGDYYDRGGYPTGPLKNPRGPETGESHVLRGGNWTSEPGDANVTNRYITNADSGNETVGFRVVRVGARMDWVSMKGGTFSMGSDKGSKAEKPVHDVTIDDFEITRSEVTVGQYMSCIAAGACSEPAGGGAYCNWIYEGREKHPMNCVDWNQAAQFATWAGGRLPTEAEWEYAARSGGLVRDYPWGDEPATCMNVVMQGVKAGCGRDSSWEVCKKTDGNTVQGLCDMSGNVWEWVYDWYADDTYTKKTTKNPTGPKTGKKRVVRGGAWVDDAESVRSWHRYSRDPDSATDDVGFRVVRVPKK